MKVLNLYAGIGGNRKLWKNVQVTSVEMNQKIADVYKSLYPQDTLVVGDAHQYLLDHYKEFDFIWSSPPCQSHSSFRHNICVRFRGTAPEYPDMKLYQEIIFLKHNFAGGFVVENVRPYYKPLIDSDTELQRHLFWSNFNIEQKKFEQDNIRSAQIPELEKLHGFNLSGVKLPNKRQVLRNCVAPAVGQHVLECYKKTKAS